MIDYERDDIADCFRILVEEAVRYSRRSLAFAILDCRYVVSGPMFKVVFGAISLADTIDYYSTSPGYDVPGLLSLELLYKLCALDWKPIDPYSPIELLALEADDE